MVWRLENEKKSDQRAKMTAHLSDRFVTWRGQSQNFLVNQSDESRTQPHASSNANRKTLAIALLH